MNACPACGFTTAEDFAFCPKCATKLTTRTAVAEERKTVTTLIADLVGFTAISELADPEEIDAMLRRYDEAARTAIEEHGGVVEKFIGDAVVGVFGVPAVREDDAERAVRAGLAIVQAVERHTRPDGEPLQVRVGVNTGKVMLRHDVSPESGENFLTGDAVNTASRLQAAAPPMRVVVGAVTHRLTTAAFAYEPLPAMELKGKAARVRAWLVKEPTAKREGRSQKGLSSPMVGRARELANFTQAIARLKEGLGGLVIVTGEAGIGKTRLVEEARKRALDLGCSWLEGRTLSFGRSISYWPFLEILQQDAGIDSDDSEAERWAKLSARIETLFGEQTPEVLPYIASLLGYPVPEELSERVRHLDGEAMGRQVYRATRLCFARLAEERPLVVVFEDVHWLDASSAALLEHLLPLTETSTLLVCCVSRPELDSALGHFQALGRDAYAERLTEIALWPLSTSDSTSLVHNLTSLDRLPAALRAAILGKAEGNPFFVEEIVRSLIDQGGLVRNESTGRYAVTEQATRIEIPDTLQGVIMARVDRLDEELKEVLRLASVIGRSFFYRVLAEIDEADRTLEDSLSGLQTRELILERARDPELEYIFKHALVQEATYESILLARRKALHLDVAEAIESLFSDRLEDFYSLLAYHYTRGEDWEKAQSYLMKAGDQAGSIAADAEALAHYEQAIEAYKRAFGDKWDPITRAVLERKMGEALFRRGEHEQAQQHLYQALSTLGHPFPTSRMGMRRAIFRQVSVQLLHRFFPWLFRGGKTSKAKRVAVERYWSYLSLALMDTGGNSDRLLLTTLLATNLAESHGLDWAAAAALGGVGYALDLVPLSRLAGFYNSHSLRLAEECQDAYALAGAHVFRAMHKYWATGDWATAIEGFRRGRDDFTAVGVIREWGFATAELIDVSVDQGALRIPLALSAELQTRGEESGDHVLEAFGKTRSGAILSAMGLFNQAEPLIRSGVADLLSSQPGDAVMGAGWLALCLIRSERTDEARAMMQEFLPTIPGNGVRGYFLRPFNIAQALLSLRDLEQRAARRPARKEAQAACDRLRRTAKADIGCTVAAYRLSGLSEWLRDRPKKAQRWWRKSLAMAEKLGMRYEGALTELEIGRRLADRAALERAAAAFEEIGAEFDLGQARELLAGLEDQQTMSAAS